MVPGLAESWTNIDPMTWEVKLRQGVTFHDGSPFTAEDVVFSLTRAPDVPNSTASFAQSVADRFSSEASRIAIEVRCRARGAWRHVRDACRVRRRPADPGPDLRQ